MRNNPLSVQGELGGRRHAPRETAQPESRKIMPWNTSEREVGAQRSADRSEAKSMT
jgi:hypothetical protein